MRCYSSKVGHSFSIGVKAVVLRQGRDQPESFSHSGPVGIYTVLSLSYI